MADSAQSSLEEALQKAKIKRKIASDLEAVSVASQRDILADLLAALEAPAPAPKQRKATNGTHAKPPDTKRDEAETNDEDANDLTRRAAVISALEEKPGRPIREVATAAYGDDGPKAVQRVRAILTLLKKRGIVRNTGFGKWSVTKKGKGETSGIA